MDLGSLFLALALLILIGVLLARPFFEKQPSPPARKFQQDETHEHQRSVLLAERDQVLTALQELDFDHTLGKIPEEEYPSQRQALLQQGVQILKQLDALQGRISSQPGKAHLKADAGMRLAALPADDQIEALISMRRQSHAELSSGFCPQCGMPIQKSDRFCSKCGRKLN